MKRTYVIAEIGINHNGDFRKIEELIRQSAIGGADYAKFQLYDSVRVFGDKSRSRNEFTFNQVGIGGADGEGISGQLLFQNVNDPNHSFCYSGFVNLFSNIFRKSS